MHCCVISRQVLAAEREAVPRLLMFPNAEKLYDAATMAQLIDHLDLCKDCCEVLGMTQNTVGLSPGSQGASFAPVPAIYLKPMQNAGYDFEVRQCEVVWAGGGCWMA